MAPRCTVCTSEHRHSIDIGLVNGMSTRELADRFDLDHRAIHRHSQAHLGPVARLAILTATKPTAIDLETLRKGESETLLAGLVAQRARLLMRADAAADAGDLAVAIAAEKAIAHNYALVGKLLGQLVQVHDVRHTNILLSPDYMRLRQVITTTLRAFPDAARALASAMHALESDAAAAMKSAAALPAPVVDGEWSEAIPPCPVPAP